MCIRDSLGSIIESIEVPEGKYIVHANTPSYVGSHITGFANMVAGFIRDLSEKTGTSTGKLCVIPGFVNPGDMREMKRIMNIMNVPFTMLPDTSGVLDLSLIHILSDRGRYTSNVQGRKRNDTIADGNTKSL